MKHVGGKHIMKTDIQGSAAFGTDEQGVMVVPVWGRAFVEEIFANQDNVLANRNFEKIIIKSFNYDISFGIDTDQTTPKPYIIDMYLCKFKSDKFPYTSISTANVEDLVDRHLQGDTGFEKIALSDYGANPFNCPSLCHYVTILNSWRFNCGANETFTEQKRFSRSFVETKDYNALSRAANRNDKFLLFIAHVPDLSGTNYGLAGSLRAVITRRVNYKFISETAPNSSNYDVAVV